MKKIVFVSEFNSILVLFLIMLCLSSFYFAIENIYKPAHNIYFEIFLILSNIMWISISIGKRNFFFRNLVFIEDDEIIVEKRGIINKRKIIGKNQIKYIWSKKNDDYGSRNNWITSNVQGWVIIEAPKKTWITVDCNNQDTEKIVMILNDWRKE